MGNEMASLCLSSLSLHLCKAEASQWQSPSLCAVSPEPGTQEARATGRVHEAVGGLPHALLPRCAVHVPGGPHALPPAAARTVISCPWFSSQIPGTEKLAARLRVPSRCKPGPPVEGPVKAAGGAGRHPKGASAPLDLHGQGSMEGRGQAQRQT